MPIETTEMVKHDKMWTHFVKSLPMLIQDLRVVITTFTNYSISTSNVTFWSRKDVTDYVRLAECTVRRALYLLKQQKSINSLSKLDYVVFWDIQHSNFEIRGLILHRYY